MHRLCHTFAAAQSTAVRKCAPGSPVSLRSKKSFSEGHRLSLPPGDVFGQPTDSRSSPSRHKRGPKSGGQTRLHGANHPFAARWAPRTRTLQHMFLRCDPASRCVNAEPPVLCAVGKCTASPAIATIRVSQIRRCSDGLLTACHAVRLSLQPAAAGVSITCGVGDSAVIGQIIYWNTAETH